MNAMKIVLVRVCVAVLVAIVLPLPYAAVKTLGISPDAFAVVIAPTGVLLIWFVLAWIEPRQRQRWSR